MPRGQLIGFSSLVLVMSATLPLGIAASAVGGRVGETRSASFVEEYVAEGYDGKLRGRFVSFVSVTPSGEVVRSFVQTPEGSLLIVTSVLYPASGIYSRRIAHEGSGWWAELYFGTEYTGETVRDYLDRGLFTSVLHQGQALLRLSSGLVMEGRWELEEGEIVDSLATSMLQNSAEDRLEGKIPDEAANALMFLHLRPSLRARDVESMTSEEILERARLPFLPGETLVALLVRLFDELEAPDDATRQKANFRRISIHPGLRPATWEQLELIRLFASVEDPETPLPDSEVISLLEGSEIRKK